MAGDAGESSGSLAGGLREHLSANANCREHHYTINGYASREAARDRLRGLRRCRCVFRLSNFVRARGGTNYQSAARPVQFLNLSLPLSRPTKCPKFPTAAWVCIPFGFHLKKNPSHRTQNSIEWALLPHLISGPRAVFKWRAFSLRFYGVLLRTNAMALSSSSYVSTIRVFPRPDVPSCWHPNRCISHEISLTTNWTSLPVAGPIRSRVSSHFRSARGIPEGFRARAVSSCASRRMGFARPSRSGRFWGRAGRRT
jgi:hypothetical protein